MMVAKLSLLEVMLKKTERGCQLHHIVTEHRKYMS